MKTKLIQFCIALALAGAMSSAYSEVIVLDSPSDFPYQLTYAEGTEDDLYFVDARTASSQPNSFAFSLTAPSTHVIASLTPFSARDLSGYFNWITEANVRLFQRIPGEDRFFLKSSKDWTATKTLKVYSLPPGDYFWNIWVYPKYGSGGSAYLFSTEITPIPEPQTYALLILGLGIIAMIARNKSKQPNNLQFA